ncbi:undecaprenyl-diphosphate phosphatase [Amycolatopsis taiwanensis]|uniref:Undecaprenyl-diphosphatase n=1 Tax=Amycolatopsis taiwanensis TaxID=342230 RepID=A0A9W6VBK3_9PSEU|nr:undecaprenyl-diphosphate phosphatase [Amycolatopsis taiwanensis]GLY65078.1 undecaprenyl-diphosphatase [Amycolatopsis taiwanensis]
MSLTYLEAIVVGAFQGVTELFPVSSLGHSVLIPALIGGQWAHDLDVSAPESPYLAFIVGLHVATAAALLVFFWRDWVRIIGGFVTSIRYRRVKTPDERLAWLIILATIPVGVCGLLLEHLFRTTLGRPIPAAAFLTANGLVLFVGERLRRRAEPQPATVPVPAKGAQTAADAHHDTGTDAVTEVLPAAGVVGSTDTSPDVRLSRQRFGPGILIGSAQILALLPGISRSGITMVAGLLRGLSHTDAARFSFLLATPVILAAGVLKIPDLFGPLGEGIHGPILAGSIASFVSAYLAVRFLDRLFRTRTLTPFAVYCGLAGAASLLWLSLS